jgi:hypothetical protein
MSDFLPKLKELFSEKQISGVLNDFEKSSFFIKYYLTQTFRKSDSRFKKKSFYVQDGYPIQLNEKLAKNLKNGKKFNILYNNLNKIINWKKGEKINYNAELKLSNKDLEETKELKMFINGSNENPEQFETWSAEKIYKQWLSLKLSDIPKPDWPIMDYVFFLFINQISCMLNSYILYGNINNELEVEAYNLYLKALDEFTKNGGLYKDLLEVHLLFCKWYDIRIKYDTRQFKKRLVKINKNINISLKTLFKKSEKDQIVYRNTDNTKIERNSFFDDVEENIRKLFNETLSLTNYSMIVFTSYFQKVEKFNRTYASPIFPILGIPFKTHDGRIYSAIGQVDHDYQHSEPLIHYFNYLYPKINSNKKIDDVRVFFEKMLFLVKLDEIKESNDAKHLLWWILHEKQFLFWIKINNTDSLTKRRNLFFDVNTLKRILEKLKHNIKNNHFFMNQFANINISPNNDNYETILSCINLLIEVCDKTLNDEKKNILFKKIYTNVVRINNNRNNLNNNRAVYGDNKFRTSPTTSRFSLKTLSNQRKAFIKGIVNNPNGSPLNNNNFSNQNSRNLNNT